MIHTYSLFLLYLINKSSENSLKTGYNSKAFVFPNHMTILCRLATRIKFRAEHHKDSDVVDIHRYAWHPISCYHLIKEWAVLYYAIPDLRDPSIGNGNKLFLLYYTTRPLKVFF